MQIEKIPKSYITYKQKIRAIGVSGSSEENDHTVAKAKLKPFKKCFLIKKAPLKIISNGAFCKYENFTLKFAQHAPLF